MEKQEIEKIISLCSLLNDSNCLLLLYGKVYDISNVQSLIYDSEYIILGIGVIKKEVYKFEGKEKLEYIKKNLNPIQNEEEFQAFEEKLTFEKKENDQRMQLSVVQQEAKLKKVIEENTSESTSNEDKKKIFEIVLNCPIKKEAIKPYYWEVFDIVGTAEKTRNIFNAKDGIKLNKNDFPQKNRYNKEEEN